MDAGATNASLAAPVPHQDWSVTYEPFYIVFILVFTLWNTRRRPVSRGASISPAELRLNGKGNPHCNGTGNGSIQAAKSKSGLLFKWLAAASSFVVYLWNYLPFAAELARFVGILIAYRITAWICYMLWGLDSSRALMDALFLVKLQALLGIAGLERVLQQLAWPHRPLMIFFNRLYKHCHIPGTATFIVWLFTWDRTLYYYWIVPFSVVNLLAFVVFATFPCTPPRLIPELGITDAMHTQPYGIVNEWQDHRFANQHAAVPSMHIGWSTFVAVGLALALSRRRLAKAAAAANAASKELNNLERAEDSDPLSVDEILQKEISESEMWKTCGPFSPGNGHYWFFALLYPFMVLLSVMITGNHFFLDAVAGLCVDALAFYITRPHRCASLKAFAFRTAESLRGRVFVTSV